MMGDGHSAIEDEKRRLDANTHQIRYENQIKNEEARSSEEMYESRCALSSLALERKKLREANLALMEAKEELMYNPVPETET